MSLLAIDIGSSTCKAVAFSVQGGILAQHAAGYAPDFPAPAHAEMDPERFWDAVCVCSRTVAKDLGDPVRALCLSSHGETFIPLNAHNRTIAPAILNQDSRATAETVWLERQLGRQRTFEITGLVAHPMYPVPKILWLRNHVPEVFSAAARFVSVIGYILVRFGLPPYIDYSLASRYLAFDVRRRCWSEEILAIADLHSDRLPIPVPTGTIAGTLAADSASQLGLPAGTLVVVGGHDQPCSALGVGAVDPGHVADSIGTYECILAAVDSPSLSDSALAACLNSYCHVVPDKFVTIAYFPSGIMVKWFHDLLYTNGAGRVDFSERSEGEHYLSLEAQAPTGPTGLCITPNLIGTCNPDFNPHARGIIAGLNPGTGRAEIYKGILEGLSCEFSRLTTVLANTVGDFQDIYVTGGGTRSKLGLALRAALTRRRLHVMRCPEAVCLGGAVLAGVAAGEYASIPQAVAQLVHEAGVIEPDPAITEAYAQQVGQYERLRSAAVPGTN
ncbi:MAG: FGGY-family carbohydrate kinase [Terriglobales bacterium]